VAGRRHHPAEQPDRDLSVVADHVVEAVNNDQSFADLRHAHITYRSDNPAVATVDRHASSPRPRTGSRTITVTVDGVSGSAPIVVTGTLTKHGAPVLAAGDSATATATFVNGSTDPVTGLDVSVTVCRPAGRPPRPHRPATTQVPGALVHDGALDGDGRGRRSTRAAVARVHGDVQPGHGPIVRATCASRTPR